MHYRCSLDGQVSPPTNLTYTDANFMTQQLMVIPRPSSSILSRCSAYCLRFNFTLLTVAIPIRSPTMVNRPIPLSSTRTRLFSSSTRARYDYRKPQAAQVQGRSILRVQGKDSAKFLKGLTCKDVDGLPGGGYSGFINPTVCRILQRCWGMLTLYMHISGTGYA